MAGSPETEQVHKVMDTTEEDMLIEGPRQYGITHQDSGPPPLPSRVESMNKDSLALKPHQQSLYCWDLVELLP